MNLAHIFKPTGTAVQKTQKAAKAMVLRKVVAKAPYRKQVAEMGSVAADLGAGSVYKRHGGGSGG